MPFAKLKFLAAMTCGAIALGSVTATIGATNANLPEDPPAKAADKTERIADVATQNVCTDHLKQIMVAMFYYYDSNQHFPSDIVDKNGKPLLSWRVAILPYIGQNNLYKQFKLDEPWDSAHNKKLSQTVVKIFQTGAEPKDSPYPMTYFQRPTGKGTAHEPGKKLSFIGMNDGMSNTLFLVMTKQPVEWAKPADLPFDLTKPTELQSPFSNVFFCSLGDGMYQKLTSGLPADVAKQLISRDGSEGIDYKQLNQIGWKRLNQRKPK